MTNKTRTFIFEKDTYTKQEVVDIVGEIVEEAKQKGFNQYRQIYLNEKDFELGEDYSIELSYKIPTTVKFYDNYTEWEVSFN